ncbi:Lin0512 family protein [Ruegeria pomeroyi]|uniref:Lin0512 family protein n=1 Tax=Ruegeria alba TaxID=2916756 RepID=A0ABS9P0Z1_9RHOB|nr:Lin0512 family protein [Ruegeria alba]MCE8514735.1 Lin0512 family protein [Ruegeria pomeroyi]MCE8548417.1 Lin0512 family protein [Ruegeria pomeroyi]MCG6560152.1 Lin0512 family protein [Ruegeria alba]
MPKTQFAVQMGMGTDLKGQDYSKAAARAVHDALHRNFLVAGAAFDLPLDAMIVHIRVGVANPDAVDLEIVKAEVPAGIVSAEAVNGGLEVEMMGHKTLIANAIVTVSYDVEIPS